MMGFQMDKEQDISRELWAGGEWEGQQDSIQLQSRLIQNPTVSQEENAHLLDMVLTGAEPRQAWGEEIGTRVGGTGL